MPFLIEKHKSNSSLSIYHLISLDLGAKKIGLAYLSFEVPVAVPLEPIHVSFRRSKNHQQNKASTQKKRKLESIKKLGDEDLISQVINRVNNPETLGVVVGDVSFPAFEDQQNTRVSSLLEALAKVKPIAIFDETFTTKIANNLLKDCGLNRKKRNMIDDSVAATIILDDFYKTFLSQAGLR